MSGEAVANLPFNSYDIDGQPDPTLTVVRGQTYSFSLVNCAFHPFFIQSTAGLGGTPYGNVTNNGGTSGTVTLTVPIHEPANTLFYHCGVHVPMGGTINVVDPTTSATPTNTPVAPTNTPGVTATATVAAATSTPTGTATPVPLGNDDDGCQIAALGGQGWLLLIPAIGLLALRRRR